MNLRLASLAAITAAAFAAPALAHHSWAIYDTDRTITLQGTVKEFEWVNPHSWLRVVNDERTGRQGLWTFELGAPAHLIETGIYPNSLKPGEIPVPVVSANNPFAKCSATNVIADGLKLEYDIVCPERGSARAHAIYKVSSDAFTGRVAMVMGAKNMTMTELQHARRIGDCISAKLGSANQ